MAYGRDRDGGNQNAKNNPIRLLSNKCDNLLNKFKKQVMDPLDSEDEGGLSPKETVHVSSTEQIERIVNDGQ